MTTLHKVESDNHVHHLDHPRLFDSLRTAKLLLVLALVPSLRASPISNPIFTADHDEQEPSRWLFLTTSVVLVLLGGAFAGLTIALMGQDEIHLQVIASSGDGRERSHASKVLKLMKKGKHWVLVTLLLSNVITNETLPIVLDRSLGGGWPAILTSTVLIVIFGEIAPQSICVRYGLPIGAWMAPFVLILMWVMAPVAWPVAKLLDYLLGEDHGTTYKKAGLKTLVTLHKTMGTSPDERLNQDEVTIISAVLDLKEKAVGDIMTPMDDAFTLSAETVLDEEMMDNILSEGYSRIPIHSPDNELNFVGMLLVKMLITYDPEDAMRVDDFALATLPETRPETSCLDIVNFFQEGKSHMVLVSDFPGESYGALGVVTLEDVIEELIGEEIIDESDVYVDVHRAIRRRTPAPRNRVPKGKVVPDSGHPDDTQVKGVNGLAGQQANVRQTIGRSISAANTNRNNKNNTSKMKDQFKLGPSNLASKPRQTRYSNFKIKPGVAPGTDPRPLRQTKSYYDKRSPVASPQTPQMAGSVGDGQLASAGKEASDAVREVRQGYGTMDRPWTGERRNTDRGDTYTSDNQGENGTGQDLHKETSNNSLLRPSRAEHGAKSPASRSQSPSRQRHARSGSILEQTVDDGGIKKIVLELNAASENDDDDDDDETNEDNVENDENHPAENADQNGESYGQKDNMASKTSSKKKRSTRKKKKKGAKNDDESSQPLLGGKD